jgi:predicted amidophosphoribosyltransferase
MTAGITADVRELIVQTQTLSAYHAGGVRNAVTLAQYYRIDETLANPVPARIAVFDDLLTKGTHFRAAKRVLQQRFPNVSVFGFFIARRAPWSGDV